MSLLMYTGQPQPPRNLRVESCQSAFVELTWLRPTTGADDPPIIEYVVYYTNSSAEDPDEVVEVDGQSVEIREGLTPDLPVTAHMLVRPWVRYAFYVAARNSLGTSEKASQSDAGTPAVCTHHRLHQHAIQITCVFILVLPINSSLSGRSDVF